MLHSRASHVVLLIQRDAKHALSHILAKINKFPFSLTQKAYKMHSFSLKKKKNAYLKKICLILKYRQQENKMQITGKCKLQRKK